MTTITKSGSKLTVESMTFKGEKIAKKIFNLKDHKGERVRTHIDIEGAYTTEIKSRQGLLVCELDVPARKWEYTSEVIDGETITESKEKELKLGSIAMINYLKKVKEKCQKI